MKLTTQAPPSARPKKSTAWYAKQPEERFESSDSMLAAVSIPKQGLYARRETSTDGPATLAGTGAAALDGAAKGATVGLVGSLIGGVIIAATTDPGNMFGPLGVALSGVIGAGMVGAIAVPVTAGIGGLVGGVRHHLRGETQVEELPGRLMNDEAQHQAVFYPDAGPGPIALGAYPRQ